MRVKDKSKIETIFKATLTLVKERGLAGITINDISKAAFIGTGTLYIYFKNKDELIKALFVECRQQSALHYFEDLRPGAPFEERMRKTFTNIISYKVNYFEVSVFLEQYYHSPFVCTTDIRKKETALKPLLDLLKEGVETKKIKNIEIQLVVSYLFGIINEMVKKAYFTKKKFSPDVIDNVYDMFWDGIKLYP